MEKLKASISRISSTRGGGNKQSTSRPSFNRQWKPRNNHPRQVNATTEDAEQPDGEEERWMRWARKISRGS